MKRITPRKRKRYWMERRFLSSWWVVATLILTYAVYERGVHHTEKKIRKLEQKQTDLMLAKEEALLEQDDLLLRIASQKDPDYIELMLMRGLGVVPEGEQKVYFKENK